MRTDTVEVIRNREADAEPRTLIGWHMPFAGVRYYKLLTDVDVALGRGRAEHVGWRPDGVVESVESADAREAVVA